jgi:chemotaxis response regulator CheB
LAEQVPRPGLKRRPVCGTAYLRVQRLPAALQHFLNRLSCSIKEGSRFMESVAKFYGSRAMGVILTGMGSDGSQGMKAIHDAGGLTIGQDEATCTVYGMPRACAELGVLMRVVPLSEIPGEMLQAVRRRRPA